MYIRKLNFTILAICAELIRKIIMNSRLNAVIILFKILKASVLLSIW